MCMKRSAQAECVRQTNPNRIMNSMENLRFDKEDYFHILVFLRVIL